LKVFFVFLLTFVSLYPQFSQAENIVADVIDSSPFAYKNQAGEYVGTHYEYLQAISMESSIGIDIHVVPRMRIIENLKKGSTDAVIMFRSEKRNPIVKYAGMIRKIKVVALNRKGSNIRTYEDLYNNTLGVGILRGMFVSERFNGDKKIKIITVNNYTQMVKMLALGRLDTIVGNTIAISNALNKADMNTDIEFPGYLLAIKQQWFQFSAKSPHTDKIQQINQAIFKLRENATFDSILTRHVGIGWQELNR
tara:strand:- start:1083 stop:1835 length:753 start_codon:yes stop_codon:yes gene_type:complete